MKSAIVRQRLQAIVPITHERLQTLAGWWRKRQAALRESNPIASEIYRQCANDLELAIRDDKRLTDA